MPPRLMHKKSRAGCKNCKARKVKCDEAQPVCAACKRHRLKCLYAAPAPLAAPPASLEPTRSAAAAQSSLTLLSSPPISTGSQSSSSINLGVISTESDDGDLPVTNERRLLELRLMHHYMQSLHEIFSGSHNAAMTEVWRDKVPVLAVRHSFLLHAVFAVATLHIITKEKEALRAASGATTRATSHKTKSSALSIAPDLTLDVMKRAREQYFNLAIRGQRTAIANLNKGNADAACIATILISNQGFILNPDPDADDKAYELPVQWLLLARSITTVYQACSGMLGPDSAIDVIIQNGRSAVMEGGSTDEDDPFFAVLMEYQPTSEPADHEAYKSSLRLLGMIRRGCEAREPSTLLSQRFSSFPHMLPSSFIGLLQQQRPRALVILACFFALTKEIENMWWFQGAARKHVEGLKALVPSDWAWAFYWIEDFAFTEDAGKRRRLLCKSGMTAP